jgi:uncharacterized protein with HEPN domain/predicted nucleotidyltransferase
VRRAEALRLLEAHRDELAREYRVTSLDLFGSLARDEAGPDSDVDLLVEFERPTSFVELVDLQHRLEAIFGTKVDLVTPAGLRPWFRDHIRREIESGGRLAMPRRAWTGRVEDILDAAAAIADYTEGMTFDTFTADRRTVDAVVRNVGIIGEAARHVPEDIRQRYPAVPWAKMYDMRNVVVHDYPGVDLTIVWEVVRNYLPPLVPVLREILEREP